MSSIDVLSSIRNDGFEINELDLTYYNHAKEEYSSHFNMESRPKELVKTTPRKGKSKFVFHPPPEAPVFKPTLEEFENPLHYINSIKPLAEKCGICKIIPPAGWKSPFVLDMNKLKFTPRIQRINELEARTRIKLFFIDQLTKFFANRGKTFQIPLIEKTPLDLYTLHRAVLDQGGIESVTKERKWNDIAVKMSFNGKGAATSLKLHYEHLIQPFLQSQQEKKDDKHTNNPYYDGKNGVPGDQEDIECTPEYLLNKQLCRLGHYDGKVSYRELKSLKFLGPGPKMAVCDGPVKTMKTRTRGKKILYEFDPLAKYMCKSCSNGDIEESLVTCMSCEDRYHSSCLFPPLLEKPIGGWKCPKCIAIDVCKPLEDFGFAQAEKEYTLIEFKQMADKFKQNYFKVATTNRVPLQKVEEEFWRVVSSIEEAVTVEYGADLHVIDHGSGFPIKGKPLEVSGIDIETYNKYAESSWNLNNLPVLKASVLRHISADISGMKIPWLYAGMCFATFCWHNEDHWSYSINYLHLGEPKTWYGVSGSMAEEFEEAMKAAAPELFEAQPDILHQLVTIMNPDDIMAAGVPVYRTDQKEGEFVITFPRAYHAGFNQGFNFAEACNFAPYDWLTIGRDCISHYSSLGRPCVFSHDELVCKMASMADELDCNVAWATINDGKAMLSAERIRRHIITKQGVYKAVKVKFEDLPDDERQCAVCNTTCFLSGVTCPCDETRLVCLEHVSNLCGCPYSVYIMKYEYQIDEIANMLMILENKTLKFNDWLSRVEEALSGCKKPKITLRALTELLIEANEKEFPRNDLIAILHYQVSKCIEVSALARTILNNKKKKSVVKKITVDELAMFVKEIDNLPCLLMETNGIKQLLNRAKSVQRLSVKNLSIKNIKKVKIVNCINWMESLNLDFKELPMLKKRLKERDWLEKTDELLGRVGPIDMNMVENLIKTANSIPVSNIFKNKKEALIKLKASLVSELPKNITSRLEQEEVIDLELEQVPDPVSDMKITSPLIQQCELDSAKLWQEKILSVLNGTTVLYTSELEELLSQGQSFSFKVLGVDELEENLKKIQHWKTLASKLFLKRNSKCTLMQSLWPRKFVARRHYYYEKENICELENMIVDGERNYTRAHYKSASSNQTRSLFKLRQDNISQRASSDFVSVLCMCGRVIVGETVVCELCQSAYHRTCFRVDENIVKSYIYGFRAKVMCSLCTRTQRPSLAEVNNLLLAAEKLTVKIPEYYVLRFFVNKVKKWQREAKLALGTNEMLNALDSIIRAMKRKCANDIKTFGKQSSIITRSLENLNRLKNLPLDETKKGNLVVEINRETLLNLRQMMMIGDSYEISTVESSQMWIIIDASKSRLLPEDDPTILKNLKVNVIDRNIKTKLERVKKVPMKQKNKAKSPLILSKTKINKKLSLSPITAQSVSTVKKPAKRKNTIKKGLVLMNKTQEGGPSVEEHEAGEPCAAGIQCVLPGDASIDWVQCDGKCGKWFHMKCVDLTHQDVTEEDEFICIPCLGGFTNPIPLPPPNTDTTNMDAAQFVALS